MRKKCLPFYWEWKSFIVAGELFVHHAFLSFQNCVTGIYEKCVDPERVCG